MESMIGSSVLQISSFGPVIKLANLGSTLSQTIRTGQRVISILDEIPMIEKVTNGDEVQFNSMDKIHVDFAYDKALILKDMNLNIQEMK